LPASAIKVICARSYSNSRKGGSVEFASLGYVDSETFKVGRVSNGILTGQDLGIINEKARLYAYMSLIAVLKGAGLGDFLLICLKKAS
jgi:hypothetical protein